MAEENGNQTQTPPADPNQGTDGHRNVSGVDFEAFKNEIMGALQGLKPASNQQTPPAQPATPPASQAGTKSELQAENERMKAQLAQFEAEKAHSTLVNVQNQAAKDAGVDLGDMASQLLGKDEATTKANVENFAKFMKAHDESTGKANTKPTDNGFAVQRNASKAATDPKGFLDSLLDDQFGKVPQK